MKKTITTIAMAMVFTFGATGAAFANGGILVGDRTGTTAPCAAEKDGILVGDIFGGFLNFIEGILVGDKTTNSTQCSTAKDGILVGD